jgi:hypothetical protein
MKASRRFAFVVLLLLSACRQIPAGGSSAVGISVPTQIPSNPPTLENSVTPTLLQDESPPARAKNEFKTDFSKHNVPYSEILSGGPPKDGIPALKDPQIVSVSEADAWLKPLEPVILVQVGEHARAYPIQILIWHEIANDTVGGEPLLVTFCPLCNTAITFKRTVNGKVLDFGTTGRLRYSNLIMYDRQTETWWQQATGEAIAGEWTGTQLEFYPATIISWQDFKASYPQGTVLSRETGYPRDYGHNPYIGYDDVNNPPFLYEGPATPNQLLPVARVLTIDLNGEAVAYPYETLEKVGAVNDMVGGEAVVIFWQAGTVSPLDSSTTASGRDVGTAAAFSRQLNPSPGSGQSGQTFSFTFVEGKILDDQTKSEWNILGQAIAGELKGKQLTPVVAINHFWFSWAAFKPQTRIYRP